MESTSDTTTVVSGGGQNIELSHRIPDSPGSRSNYGEFYWDTNGENTYHPSDSFDSDLMLDTDNYGRDTSAARLDRTQEDLSKYRQRIDANVEQQKEYSDMMSALQQKVQEYRRHITELENKLLARRTTQEPSSFTIIDSTVFPDSKYKDDMLWSPKKKYTDDYEMLARFEDERRRNEEFRMQLEHERMQNDQLQNEIERLRQEFEISIRDKERTQRIHQNRERNLAQYLSEEQKKMMDLWTELQRVRKQLAEHKQQTVHDLENQRNEFIKVVRSITGVTQQLNLPGVAGHPGPTQPVLFGLSDVGGGSAAGGTTINHDAVLYEAIRRFRDSQKTAGPSTAATTLINEFKLGSAATDSDINAELMKKYEESIERNIELESKGDEAQRKIAALEAELRRTKERLADNQAALRKLHELAQEAHRSAEAHKRTRSLSPGSTPLPPSEALRSVRSILRNKDNEIQQLERKLKITETQMKEFMGKFEAADEARRRLDKQLADAKRDISNNLKAVEDAKRQERRLADRLRAAEAEKAAAEKARKYLEEELNKLQQQFQKSSTDGERKAREEAVELNQKLEEEFKNRINEMMRRMETLQRDNAKVKSECNMVKDKYRDIENEYNTTLRKIEERGYKQKDELSRQLFDIKHRMENEKAAREDAEKQKQRCVDDTEKLKEQITEYERQLMMVRHHNDELDTQAKSTQAKMTAIENDLVTNQKEIEKLSELNNRTVGFNYINQQGNQKHKAEADLDASKEQARKLEQESEKLKNENKILEGKEQRANDALTQQTNKAHLLQKELEEAKNEIEELERKLKRMEEDFTERLRGSIHSKGSEDDTGRDKGGAVPGSVSTYHDSQITEIRIKEINDKWKHDLEQLENEKDELERRIRELEDQLAEKDRSADRQDSDIAELKRRHQAEIDRIKAEMGHLYDKHQNDLDEEKEQYNKNLESIKIVEEELRAKLSAAEQKVAESQNRENELERENREWDEKYQAVSNQIQKLKDDLEDTRNEADKEIQKWKTDAYSVRSELKAIEASNSAMKTQLVSANDRCEALNKTVNDHNAKIRDLNTLIRHLEEELSDAKSALSSRDADLEGALGRIRSLEEQLAAAQLENNKIRSELDTLQRENETLKGTNAAQESEIERLKNKLLQAETTMKEQKNTVDHFRTERERLQNVYREKAKQADHLNQLAQSFDTKLNKMRKELQDNSDKFIAADAERAALRSELSKLQQELQFGKDQMVRKTDEYQSSLEDLANAHRAAEDGRLNALQELESRKYEIADLQSRLENADQRLISLQQEYMKADSERDILLDALRRFQSAANRAVTLNRYRQAVSHEDSEDITLEQPDETDGPFHSVPFPPSVDYTSGGAGGVIHTGGTTTINIDQPIDINQLESTLQTLIGRIEKLERERNEYREALNRLKKKTSDTHTTITRRETRYKTIEENLNDAEEEKRALEARLASAKQLLRSQEEALKQRDEERRQMKSKMVTTELHARGKEAQLRHLNEQLKNLRTDLENAHADIRQLRDNEEQWDANRFQLESKIRDQNGEVQRLNLLMVNVESEKQNLAEKVKELTGQLQLSEIKCVDMKEDTERLKRELSKAESVEIELRRTADQHSKISNEYQMLRDQINNAQNELANANNRKQQLENELLSVRTELREFKQRVHDINNRALDLQRQLQDEHAEKNRLDQKILNLEKAMAEQKTTENELRQQVESSKNDKKILQKELEDTRYRLSQIENDKKSLAQHFDALRRERLAQLKKIDMLENEKRRTDAAIRETALQREAIEKSLNAMERENKELYKNCAQLQQQIAQLEMENGNRIMELTNRQREEQERYLQRMRNEKQHVERIIENRERTQQNRIKQLENQLSMMREQLDNERRRRRDYVDRSLAGDMSKLGGGFLGLRTTGIHSAGILPHLDTEYTGGVNRYVRSTFASNPLTPPLGTSTPTHARYGGIDESQISPKQQDVDQSYISTSSYHPSMTGSVTDYSKLETLEPSKEIEGRLVCSGNIRIILAKN
ncbi:unnamed protein product [Toxocara canis]|uniref:Major antigen n=1 Tax=Toxocara canis TaxID=6265 RepID=A0A183UUF4_TOXCA|nr:unnamed protein product [Toxocara canis]